MKKFRVLTIRLDPKVHNDLRKLAYLHEKHLSEIIREAICETICNHKKVLTNSDVVVS